MPDRVSPTPEEIERRKQGILMAPQRGLAVSMGILPAPNLSGWPRGASSVHGALSSVAAGHVSSWSFWPAPDGLAVYWYVREHGQRVVATGDREVELWGRRSLLRWGDEIPQAARLPTYRGEREIEIRALTPVVTRTSSNAGNPVPTDLSIRSALVQGVSQRLGLPLLDPSEVALRIVRQRTHSKRINLGGKSGLVIGWVGSVTVRCDAVCAALLSLSGSCGLGSKTAFGCGFVHVHMCG